MILDTSGAYPVVNGHRVRYVTIMRPGWYGCNDDVYDWDGWRKEKDRPIILDLLTAAARCRFTKISHTGGSFERRMPGQKETEIVRFGFEEKVNARQG